MTIAKTYSNFDTDGNIKIKFLEDTNLLYFSVAPNYKINIFNETRQEVLQKDIYHLLRYREEGYKYLWSNLNPPDKRFIELKYLVKKGETIQIKVTPIKNVENVEFSFVLIQKINNKND